MAGVKSERSKFDPGCRVIRPRPGRTMTRLLCIAAAWLLCATGLAAQTFGGVKIGADATAVAGFPGPVALSSNGPDRFAKFRMPDGHDLSLTTRNFGPIIYMENNRNPAIAPVNGPGLNFGLTTRADLTQALGNDGYVYANRDRIQLGPNVVIFHSYELTNEPGVVATFAFLLTPDRQTLGDDAAVLDGIIVAQAWYLDEIWGTQKTGRPGYAPIALQY